MSSQAIGHPSDPVTCTTSERGDGSLVMHVVGVTQKDEIATTDRAISPSTVDDISNLAVLGNKIDTGDAGGLAVWADCAAGAPSALVLRPVLYAKDGTPMGLADTLTLTASTTARLSIAGNYATTVLYLDVLCARSVSLAVAATGGVAWQLHARPL